MRRLLHLLLAALASCDGPASEACGDGTYCPVDMRCGAPQVCLVEIGACDQFEDHTPCLGELGRGTCEAGVCDPGVEVLGNAVGGAGFGPLPGVEISIRERPDVLPVVSNLNGFFSIFAARRTTIVLELAYPDALPVVTRPIAVGQQGVPLDYLYGGIPIVSSALAMLLAVQIGATLAPGRGILVGEAVAATSQGGLGDVTVAVTPRTCEGPYYFDQNYLPVLAASATLAGSGRFAFINCLPGPLALTAAHANGGCRALDASAPGSIPVAIEADTIVAIGRLTCAP